LTAFRPQFHTAAEMFDDLAADRQAQPGALRAVRVVAALPDHLASLGLC